MTDETTNDETEQDDVFDEDKDENTTVESDATGDAPPSGSDSKTEANSEKRIRDLMSRAQKAEAEVAKLRKPAETKDSADGGSTAKAEADELREFLRENVRQQLFEREPRLAQYGIEATAIEGTTVTEMTASFERQRKLIGAIETRARSVVLEEHGLDPDVGGGSAEAPVDFNAMPKTEFDALVERAKRG